jgi:hypothetical protein
MRLATPIQVLAALCLATGLATAQGHDMRAQIEQKMREISQLMRESERLLLEITHVDRLVGRQQEIVRELEKLQQQPPSEAAAAQREERRRELQGRQQEVQRKLEEMLGDQERQAQLTVTQLEELLKSWPRSQQQGGGGGEKDKGRSKPKDERKRLQDQREERKQREPMSPREKRDRQKEEQKRGARKPGDPGSEAARLKRIEAWFVRLPPEIQERINKGDYGAIPPRYRRLVREYTALRAKRESEKRDAEER